MVRTLQLVRKNLGSRQPDEDDGISSFSPEDLIEVELVCSGNRCSDWPGDIITSGSTVCQTRAWPFLEKYCKCNPDQVFSPRGEIRRIKLIPGHMIPHGQRTIGAARWLGNSLGLWPLDIESVVLLTCNQEGRIRDVCNRNWVSTVVLMHEVIMWKGEPRIPSLNPHPHGFGMTLNLMYANGQTLSPRVLFAFEERTVV